MFVGSVTLGATGLELVVVPLKGTRLDGRWDISTDLLILCVIQTGRFCICNADDHPNRFQEELKVGEADAKALADWLSKTFQN